MSPSPKKEIPTTMDFYEAIKQVVAGKKIHKIEWSDKKYYVFLNEGILSIHAPDGNHEWIISEADLMGNDYVIAEQ